jgi:very-short-patch-repair endonuclease
VLEKLNIQFIQQYKFDDCKINYRLLFDFYLPQYNCCIEYDGRQHYEIVERFGGLEGFISTKIRDTYKNWYCEKNNIKIIRISYKDFENIEKILDKEFE